jgi:hypothetical protein
VARKEKEKATRVRPERATKAKADGLTEVEPTVGAMVPMITAAQTADGITAVTNKAEVTTPEVVTVVATIWQLGLWRWRKQLERPELEACARRQQRKVPQKKMHYPICEYAGQESYITNNHDKEMPVL